MIALIADIATGVLLAAGGFFVVTGGIGMLRLPDFYTRMHAAGITDTLGAELILFGLFLQAGLSIAGFKLLAILFFLFFTSPTATHAVANAAWTAGLRPILGPLPGTPPAQGTAYTPAGAPKGEEVTQ